MTMAKKAITTAATKVANNQLSVRKTDDEDTHVATARAILGPDFRHALVASQVAKAQLGSMAGAPGFGDYADAIREHGDIAVKGELAFVSRALAAQATTLDSIFTEAARRMAVNMGEHLSATETYSRIAFKAQAQSRATLEALAKMHQPREQTVRHVHVNEGGQAVVADHFHNHTGGRAIGKNDEQSDATAAAGTNASLPCPDPLGNGVPIPSRKGQAAMPDARRDEPRPA